MKDKGEKKRSRFAQVVPWLLVTAVASSWLYGRLGPGFALGERAGESLAGMLKVMALALPAAFVLIGLFDVWVPREIVERRIGERAGLAAIPWLVLLATLQAGPLYVAFPVAIALWRKGCTRRNVFIFLGAFSALKIPMLTFEVTFLGWWFSLARVLLTLPVFIALGFVLDGLLPAGPFQSIPNSLNHERNVR